MDFFGYLQMLLHDTIGLVTILNPVAAAAIMISTSQEGFSSRDARSIGQKAAMTVLIASLSTVFFGNLIFELFGINTSSVMVIGGIILLLMSVHMVQGRISETNHTPEESEAAAEKENIAVIPIGIPILFGPGVISTLMVFKAKASTLLETLILFGAVIISTAVVYAVLLNAIYLVRMLGVNGLKIMTRLMGLVVGAIASQFVIYGVQGLWHA